MSIITFKSKAQNLKEWHDAVYQENLSQPNIKSAMLLYEHVDKDGSQAHAAWFECDLNQMKWFHKCLGEKIKELEFDKFLREHIDEYLEYVN